MLDIIVRLFFIPLSLIWVISLLPAFIRDVKLWTKECFGSKQQCKQQQQCIHHKPLFVVKEVIR